MIYVRDGLSFSNENSALAEALARWLSRRKRERKASGKPRQAKVSEKKG